MPLPGARQIMDNVRPSSPQYVVVLALMRPHQLAPSRSYPNPSWTICTSATRAYGSSVLNAVGIELPDAIVFANDVQLGKPQYVPPDR